MSENSESGVVYREKQNLTPSKSQNNLNDIENEHKIYSLNEISVGDHIVLFVDQKHYCHAILVDVDYNKQTIQIIYYDGAEFQCSLDDFLLDDQSPADVIAGSVSKSNEDICGEKKVKKISLLIDLDTIEIYKVDYVAIKEKTLPVNETLEKANSFVGKSKYNIFTNNDEHFAIYCKTGKAAKLFIVNPKDLTAKKIIGKDISDKIVGTLAQQGGQIILVNTAKHIASKFPRSAVSAVLPAAAEAASGAIGAGIEGISTGYDIYKKHKELKEGKINDLKFKKYVAKRVTRGTMSVAGGITGGILGQMIIPIPVVGAVIGGLVGGMVGAVVGQGEGILLGELVEVIDDKIKEKKASKAEQDELNSNEENTEKSAIILNANQNINQDDYEIYVLNDTNEIITDLNLDKALDMNGAILKRQSIEAFSGDQLPSDINVYFKVPDHLK